MDLISVRRKYRNIRNIIIIAFLITLCIILALIAKEMHRKIISKEIYKSYTEQCEKATLDEQQKEEQKKLAEEAARKERLPNLTEEGKKNMENIYHSESKRVFLTFDDGPSQTVTIPILDTLKQENVKATFFLLGSRVELNPDIVKREFEEGHFLAIHGYSHVYSQIYLSSQSVLDEYNK